MAKILIIRFSSIGDIIQCMSVTRGIKKAVPGIEIQWLTRKDMSPMLKTDEDIDHIWEFDRKDGIWGLIKLVFEIKKQKFDYVYDAHLNLRSSIVKSILCPKPLSWLGLGPKCIIRYKSRLRRILFFNFNVRTALELPFRGMLSFQKPLLKKRLFQHNEDSKWWEFPSNVRDRVHAILRENNLMKDDFITLIPSAAWELKRWPVEHWMRLIELMPNQRFIIIAGPDDQFTNDIKSVAPERVLNLAGQTNLLESFYAVFISKLIISADTGFLHAADLFRKNAIAFMGPTAFGHPTGNTVEVLELDLPCRPCSKEGNAVCKLSEIKKCLVDITPEMVVKEINIKLDL